MGHQRLGEIPKTQRWNAVVAKVAGGASGGGAPERLTGDVSDIASETLLASEAGLQHALDDPGLRFTFYLLTQLVLAAREKNWQSGLAETGVELSADSSLFDLTAEVHRVIDEHVRRYGRSSAVSEMAQQAAGEAIAALAGPNAVTLFGSGRDELQDAVRKLSTKSGFARLGQQFFACFMARFLNFHLSRVTPQYLGANRSARAEDLTEFNQALQSHCLQSARIVHDFCGEWYSKTEFQRGIDLENTSGFLAIALKKLQAELSRQREGL